MSISEHPTWESCISELFAAPYWIDQADRKSVGMDWKSNMSGYGVYLDQYESVVTWAGTIYDFLYCRFMPLTATEDSPEKWPAEAVEALRIWINEGHRETEASPISGGTIIPPPVLKPIKIRVRQNIVTMSESELNLYRMKLDEIRIGDPDPKSAWQRLALVHTYWCLHYQEAFLPWHRANLLYLEHLIDFPIPYWDFLSEHAAEDGHPEAGLPQAFKDMTYVHPLTGEVRPNPLRFAAAKNGESKACAVAGSDHQEGDETPCRFVHRFPILYTEGDDCREQRQEYLNWLPRFRKQVFHAFSHQQFSKPQGSGFPWANLPAFTIPQADDLYTPGEPETYFDAQLEQPHDNYHGWVGPDMADNAYTCFDPVFWSLHSNIDRVFEAWTRAHPSQVYCSNFPLRPFIGNQVRIYNEREPRTYRFTTVGEMVKDSRGLGYDYEQPFPIADLKVESSGPRLSVAFRDVRCVSDSYLVDVFINLPDPQPEDITRNPDHYVGRSTRLSMGVVDDKGRCVKQGVTRVLDASENARSLGLNPKSEVTASVLVRRLFTSEIVEREEHCKLPGFAPTCSWSAVPSASLPIISPG